MHPDYFQGIMQLRNVDQELIDFVVAQFAKHKVAIAKIKPLKTGVDIYSASNRFSRNLGRKIQKQFGGELIESVRIFTRDKFTSKDVYRLNVLYRAFPVKKGDVIARDTRVYQITSLDRQHLVLLDLATGHKTRLRFEDDRALPLHATEVVRIKPEVYVLDDSYQEIQLLNPGKVKVGSSVTVVFCNGSAYLVK